MTPATVLSAIGGLVSSHMARFTKSPFITSRTQGNRLEVTCRDQETGECKVYLISVAEIDSHTCDPVKDGEESDTQVAAAAPSDAPDEPGCCGENPGDTQCG